MEDLLFDRLRREVEAKTGPFVCVVVDGKIASISASAVAALGISADADLGGRDVSEFLVLPDGDGDVTLADGTPLKIELRRESIDCSNRHIEALVERRQPKEGPLSDLSASRFNYLARILTDVVLICEDGKIAFCNEGAARVLRYESVDDLIGMELAALVHPDFAEIVAENILDLFDDGAMVPLKLKQSDGEFIDVEIIAGPLIDGDREQAVVVARDISKYKANAESLRSTHSQLLMAQKMESLGQLAGGIAHEINTPAQYVSDNIRFFQKTADMLAPLFAILAEWRKEDGEAASLDTDALKEAIDAADVEFLLEDFAAAADQAHEGIEIISRIVGAMKDFSHPGSQERVEVDINRLIETSLTVSRNEWKHHAQVEEDLCDGNPAVLAPQGALNQVLVNIIVNAGHAIAATGRSDGRIGIKTRVDGDKLCLEISDNGCGIPKHHLDKVFDPFFTTKEVGKGTGQGLSIAYDVIVKKLNGTLTVESEPDEGTTFVITLPLIEASVAAA